MRYKIIIAIIIVLFGLLLPAKQVMAISDPNNISVESVKVFTNIFETGDWLVVAHTNVNYGAIVPTEAPQNIYAVYLYDGATILASIDLPEWNSTIVSFWFDASKVISKGLVWNAAYTIKIQSKAPYSLTPAIKSLVGSYLSGDQTTSRAYLSRYITDRMDIAGNENNTSYVTTTLSGKILNVEGSEIVLAAIPGVGTILEIFQASSTVVDIGRITHNETYQETLMKYMMLADAESVLSWTGTSINTTWDRTQGDWAIIDTVPASVVGASYNSTYNPGGVWNLTSYQGLSFAIKNSKYSQNFTQARIYLYDSSDNYVYWNMSFNPGLWTFITTNNLTGDGGGGGFDKSITDKIVFEFSTGTAMSFYSIYDGVVAYQQRDLTRGGFAGFAEYLHVSAEALAVIFFLMIYLITASVIYMVTGNGIGSMALAIPALLFAAYPLGLVPLALIFVFAIILIMAFAYFIFLR